jgi:hypothetical protein
LSEYSYGRPLSSDAFSAFGSTDSEIHNREIEEATLHMESVVVPKFSDWLEDNEPGTTSDDHSLSQLMHRNGINVRYLGVLYHLAKRSVVRKAIFREICVRVIKNTLRERLRQVILPYLLLHLLSCSPSPNQPLPSLPAYSKCEHWEQR